MTREQIAALTVILLLSGAVGIITVNSELSASNYRQLLSEHPEQQVLVLKNVSGNVEVLSRGDSDFMRWKYVKDKTSVYFGTDLVDTAYWRVFNGTRQVKYFNLTGSEVVVNEDSVSLSLAYSYFFDSSKKRKAGTLTRNITLYPQINNEIVTWQPVDDEKYNLRWIHETDELGRSESLLTFQGRYVNKKLLEVNWKDSRNLISSERIYKNGRIYINYKSAYDVQVIDPAFGSESVVIDKGHILSKNGGGYWEVSGIFHVNQSPFNVHPNDWFYINISNRLSSSSDITFSLSEEVRLVNLQKAFVIELNGSDPSNATVLYNFTNWTSVKTFSFNNGSKSSVGITLPNLSVGDARYRMMISYAFGKLSRETEYSLIMNASVLGKQRILDFDPILYGSNIALTATNCYANETYAVDVNATSYGCGRLFDGAIAPLTSCWVTEDNAGGGMTDGAYASIQLNRSYNIGTINITQGSASSYVAGNISVEFSSDSTNGFNDGTWTKVAQVNMSSSDTSAVNLTNVDGFGNATWIRFNVTNSSSTDSNKAIGLCEVLIYEFQSVPPAVAPVAFPVVNVSILNSTSPNVSVSLASEHIFSLVNYSGSGQEKNSTFKWFINNTNQSWGGGNKTAELVPMIYKGAVGYWHLDENGGTNGYADSSGQGNHVTVMNSVPLNVSGRIRGGVQFDGDDDYLTVPHSASLNLSDNITVSLWF